jgi:hypothetical protein
MIHKEKDHQIHAKGEVGNKISWMINKNARKFLGQGFIERNMALIGFAQLDTNTNFFDTTSAQGDLGWSSGQAMGFYKLCRCKFKGETRKG